MKNKIISTGIIAMFIILFTSVTFAATGAVELKSNVTQVKKGEIFTVTLSATSEEGINGIDTRYTYDSEKLELISENVADSSNWSSIGTSPNITVICNSTQSIKNADIYVLKFKVKDNVTVGSTLKIETNDILLDTDAQTDSEVTISSKKLEITVIDDTQKDDEKKDDEKEDDIKKDDIKKDNTEKDDTNKQVNGNSTNSAGLEIKNNTVNSNNISSSKSPSVLPKTGEISIVIVTFIIIAIILSIIFYRKYIKHKDIK